MYCGDVAVRPVITITLDKTIEEAAALMTQHHVGLLVIVEKDNPKKPIGVVSERDLIKAIANKIPPTETIDKVGTIEKFIYVYKDDLITTAAQKMKLHKVRHLVVLERDGTLYGVISIRDLIGEKSILDILARDRAPTEE
ncbi:MAG: CBS domain-containing protein [Pyrobaculum sp.]